MAARGAHSYVFLSSGSNNVVKRAPGSLYGLHGVLAAGGSIRIDDAHSFNQGVLDLNAVGSNTMGRFGIGLVDGIGFDSGLVVAFSSNTAGVTVEYE
jgi:hypothetical protein